MPFVLLTGKLHTGAYKRLASTKTARKATTRGRRKEKNMEKREGSAVMFFLVFEGCITLLDIGSDECNLHTPSKTH